jgi:hypothetical protein
MQVNWINLRSMGMRKEMRLRLALPVRISGENADGGLFEQACKTVDLTVNGVRIEGLMQTVLCGAVISVRYGDKSVPAQVMWTGKMGSKSQGHVGLQVIGGWNNLWRRAIPYIPGDAFCNFTNQPTEPVSNEPGFKPGTKYVVRGPVADLSLNGCYVAMVTPLNVHDRLFLTLKIHGTEIRTEAEVLTSHPGLGMRLKFVNMAETDRAGLQALIARLGYSGSGPVTNQQMIAPEKNNQQTAPAANDQKATPATEDSSSGACGAA